MEEEQQTSEVAATQSTRPPPSIAYVELMKPDEDWRSLQNRTERRKLQNRLAQRAYRRSMRQKTTEVEVLRKQLQNFQESQSKPSSDKNKENSRGQRSNKCQPDKAEEAVGRATLLDQSSPQNRSPTDSKPLDFEHVDNSNRSKSTCRMGTVTQSNQTVGNDRFKSDNSLQTSMSSWSHSQQPDNQDPLHLPDMSDYPMSGELFRPDPEPSSQAASTIHHTLPDVASMIGDFSFDLKPPQTLRGTPTAMTLGLQTNTAPLLHLAIAGGHLETIKVLLQGADVSLDKRDSAGFTPLQRAAMLGHAQIVSLLLDHGAGVNCDDL